ncbi:putative membrane protein [Salegentibacter echinorum]|uniref:Putative membrane protein n=1 Tax=Salegentibacter echinorum TaxID=1073325 RepID=A0A1M5BKR2_SALEC|nr:SHOCT domain-containing protein [Salegentibacter echinorum]SHF42792.1 putative membrane protein [Salegentibacter echinorum]
MMMFWWIVIGVIVVAAVFLPLSSWLGKNQKIDDSPIQILEKRYAKGEISKEEFEEQKNNLKRR